MAELTAAVNEYSHCSLVPRPLYLTAVEKNREKAWDQNYVTDRKW